MMDKTDKILNMLSKPEAAMVVPIGSDVVIPNLSGIKGNKDAMNKLTLQTVTDNGATTTNEITKIGTNAASAQDAFTVTDGTNEVAKMYNYGSEGIIVLKSNATTRVNLAVTTGSYNYTSFAVGQSGVAETSSVLEAESTSKGFLPPRMTTAQKNAIGSPATGLVVFDTDLGKLCVYSGGWQTITSA